MHARDNILNNFLNHYLKFTIIIYEADIYKQLKLYGLIYLIVIFIYKPLLL